MLYRMFPRLSKEHTFCIKIIKIKVHFLILYTLPPSFYSTFHVTYHHVTSQIEADNARKCEQKKTKNDQLPINQHWFT
ncbi:Uncharacterised protein [Escherichia coli]|uniref:Uncharacterized protein n=1 Tax=Escherichia coli TaxID=562 RepID=A0A376VWB7_ECOLX|nr:Uncharacterised protein [Escherichia coli]